MTQMQSVSRAAIVAETMSWLGTPYRHQASLKSVGCDCLGLIRGIWRSHFGAEPEAIAPYTPDWAEACGDEPLVAAARRHLQEIAISAAEPGDVLLFRWRPGMPAKHAGVLVAADRFVHAHQGAAVAPASYSRWWRERPHTPLSG
jgi:NlpC/P60 family putative phage cell wall peptidase